MMIKGPRTRSPSAPSSLHSPVHGRSIGQRGAQRKREGAFSSSHGAMADERLRGAFNCATRRGDGAGRSATTRAPAVFYARRRLDV